MRGEPVPPQAPRCGAVSGAHPMCPEDNPSGVRTLSELTEDVEMAERDVRHVEIANGRYEAAFGGI